MQRSPLVPIVGFGLIGLALLLAVLITTSFLDPVTGASPDPRPSSSGDPSPGAGSPTPSVSPDPSTTPGSPSATPSTPPPGPSATTAADADPQRAFAEFVLRLGAARETADRLMDDLQAAAEAGDDDGVRAAAQDVGALVETERAWLADHPPAACYAQAHREADAMYVAFGVAADAGVAWADADGLAAIPALLEALDAVGRAIQAAEDLTATLRLVDCA